MWKACLAINRLVLEQIQVWYLLNRKSLSSLSCKRENCIGEGLPIPLRCLNQYYLKYISLLITKSNREFYLCGCEVFIDKVLRVIWWLYWATCLVWSIFLPSRSWDSGIRSMTIVKLAFNRLDRGSQYMHHDDRGGTFRNSRCRADCGVGLHDRRRGGF